MFHFKRALVSPCAIALLGLGQTIALAGDSAGVTSLRPDAVSPPGVDSVETFQSLGVIHIHEGESIQAAIQAADDGDEIIVHPGTYDENINLLGKAITVRSTDPVDPEVVASTIIDGGAVGRVISCNHGEGPDTLISGFVVRNGDAFSGGGMYNHNSSPTVTFCAFTSNSASYGGGMYNESASPTVIDCTFTENSTSTYGGGMHNRDDSSPIITGCTFTGNTARSGGGTFNFHSSPVFARCAFTDNVAESGAGTTNSVGGNAAFRNCSFDGNTATKRGGGIYNVNGSSPTLNDCTFAENSAANGGAMGNWSSAPTVTNCTFSANSAQYGGALYNCSGSDPTVTNCILWGDTGNEIYNYGGCHPYVTYCGIQGGWPGEGNIDVNPLFVDPDNGVYQLAPGSPCIDAGDNYAVTDEIVTDLAGNPRFVDDPDTQDTGLGSPPIVDMGAFEYQAWPCPADIHSDGVVDEFDLALVLALWGSTDNIPADINDDGVVDVIDLLSLLGAWGPCE